MCDRTVACILQLLIVMQEEFTARNVQEESTHCKMNTCEIAGYNGNDHGNYILLAMWQQNFRIPDNSTMRRMTKVLQVNPL